MTLLDPRANPARTIAASAEDLSRLFGLARFAPARREFYRGDCNFVWLAHYFKCPFAFCVDCSAPHVARLWYLIPHCLRTPLGLTMKSLL